MSCCGNYSKRDAGSDKSKAGACFFYDKCEDVCPNPCEDICVAGSWQRGLCVKNTGVLGNVPEAHHLWLFIISVCNCTNRAITCFNVYQYLTWFNEDAGTFVNLGEMAGSIPKVLSTTVSVFVNSTLGSANGTSTGVPSSTSYLGYGTRANLLTSTIRLPVGCSTYKVFIETKPQHYDIWAALTLRPVVINARGQISCCSGACKAFEKTEVVPGECLPTETNSD